MKLSARKVNRLLQLTDRDRWGWYSTLYGTKLILFLATLPITLVKDKRIHIRITRKELANRMHMGMQDLSRLLEELIKDNRLRKEVGHDTVNVYVSLPVSFLYDDD